MKEQPQSPFDVVKEQKQSLKIRFQNLLVSLINPVIFKNYIKKMKEREKKRKKEDMINQTIQEVDEHESSIIDKSNEIKHPDHSSLLLLEDEDEEVNLQDELPKERIEYDLNWKNYMALIAYAIASNTDALVFLFFFVNHIVYASLESVLFPLSVLGYAVLEYPRPPARFFRYMLVYTQLVFFVKYCCQFQLWSYVFVDLKNFDDT